MRARLAGLLVLIACLVLPVAVASAWTAARITDTDGWVGATAPLAADPVVRREVSRRLVALVDASLSGDADALLPGSGALRDTVVEQAVAGALRSGLFARTWTAANRAAHDQLLAGLRQSDAGSVTLDLGPVLNSVVDELAGYGLPVAELSPGRTTITLATGPRLEPAQRAYRVLDAIDWLGVVAWVRLAALALLVSPGQRRTTGLLAWGTVLTAGAGLAALVLGRRAAVSSLPGSDRALVGTVVDTVTSSLQRGLLVTVVVAGVAGLVALVRRRATA